jgi:hypothetical protein
MSQSEVVIFVHQALFRSAPAGPLDDAAVDSLARAFWDTLCRSPVEAPAPYGSPSGAWLQSHELHEWLDTNADQLRYDLPLFVSVQHTAPASGAPERKVHGTGRRH